MLSGTAQITNANISTLNVSDLTVDTTISIASLNLSNLSVDQNVSIGGDIVEVGNITSAGNLEFFNISAINEIETDNIIANTATFNGDVNLTTGTMFGNAVGSFATFTSIGGGSIQSTIRIEGPLANISIINASDITAEDLHVSGGIFTADNATVFGNTSTATLTCDLTPNLTAGTGITITSVGGKPTITATGGGSGTVPDPLNLSQLNASNISVDGDIELIGTSNISANATTATVFTVVAENVSVSNDILCSNLTSSYALESIANTSVGFDLSVGNDATIAGYLTYNPRFIARYRSSSYTMGGTGPQGAQFNGLLNAKNGGVFTTVGTDGIRVNVAGWYRFYWTIGYRRVANTGGERFASRSYLGVAAAGTTTYVFSGISGSISSACYIRSSSLCPRTYITGYAFRYLEANETARVTIDCSIQGNANWSSSFAGTEFVVNSRFAAELVSTSPET
jgi:hypothetical protein